MLTETPLTIPVAPDRDHRPAVAVPADPRDVPGADEAAAHEARAARVERAFEAIEALGRRRRAQELVEAIERLGAGLDTTMVALDGAVSAVFDAHRSALPAPAPPRALEAPRAPEPPRALEAPAWAPISQPVVPITAFVAAPAAPAAVALAPVPAAAPLVAVPAEVVQATVVADVAPARPRRQAPAGLAAFVIDFPEITG
jgi:hypothetical protein